MNLVLEDQAKDGTDGAHHHAHHAQGHAQPGATTDKAAVSNLKCNTAG
jgi:hypothetical protein